MNPKLKVVLLAGGMGTRMWKLTHEGNKIPKPLLPIAEKSILEHIMDNYRLHGIREFIICGGYQYHKLKEYFDLLEQKGAYSDCKIHVVDTGFETMTGGRIARVKDFLKGHDSFLLSYGDALSDIDITELIKTFNEKKSLVTVSVKSIKNRFGEVFMDEEKKEVIKFTEKKNSWVNIGFYVLSTAVLDLISGDGCVFEKDILEKMIPPSQMNYYIHDNFWVCMDTEEEYKTQCKIYKIKT